MCERRVPSTDQGPSFRAAGAPASLRMSVFKMGPMSDQVDLFREVFPFRVHLCNRGLLPFSGFTFYVPLSVAGFFDRITGLEVDRFKNIVAGREAFRIAFRLVFPKSRGKIIC